MYFIVLCSIVNPWGNSVGITFYCRAGRQHGACSETFWASCIMLFVFPGKDGRVTGSTESLPESQMDYAHFLSLLAYISPPLFYTIHWKQPPSLMWPFPVCGSRTKEVCFLSMLLPSLSHSVSVYPLPCLQSPSLPFFNVSVLMIYFCKNVWPMLSQSFKWLFKRESHVNYFRHRQVRS